MAIISMGLGAPMQLGMYNSDPFGVLKTGLTYPLQGGRGSDGGLALNKAISLSAAIEWQYNWLKLMTISFR